MALNAYLQGHILTSLGLIMVSFPMVFFLARLFLRPIARTSANLNLGSVIVGVGTLMLIYDVLVVQAGVMAMLGLLLSIFWLLYIKWYSIFPERSSPLLAVGNTLPNLKLENSEGGEVHTDNFKGSRCILLFYRGNWCPLCMAQVKELVEEYKTLSARNIKTLLISPQPHRYTRSLANKYGVDFEYLVDNDNRVAEQLNIHSNNGLPTGLQVYGYSSDTVLPTIILTDEKGVILYADLTQNYRVRPEPAELLAFFDGPSPAKVTQNFQQVSLGSLDNS